MQRAEGVITQSRRVVFLHSYFISVTPSRQQQDLKHPQNKKCHLETLPTKSPLLLSWLTAGPQVSMWSWLEAPSSWQSSGYDPRLSSTAARVQRSKLFVRCFPVLCPSNSSGNHYITFWFNCIVQAICKNTADKVWERSLCLQLS